jgi:hypothetical protein
VKRRTPFRYSADCEYFDLKCMPMKKAEGQEMNMENTSEGLRMYERHSTTNNSRVSEIKRKIITNLNVVYIFQRNITVFLT